MSCATNRTYLDYTTNRIQFKCEYNVSGTVYSSMDKAEDGRNGYVDVEIRPMYIEQAFDRRISVGGSTSFSFDAFYWKGVEDGLTYEVQYRDASGNWVAVGSDSTLFPSSKYKISYVTKTDDNDALGGGVWYPSDFWVPDSFTGSDAKMNAGKSTFNKHTTVTLELSNAAMDWDGTDFRCVFTYKSTGHTMSTDTTTANDIAQARTGHLIIYAPPIEMTPVSTDAAWFQEHIYLQPGVRVHFLPERVKFTNRLLPSYAKYGQNGTKDPAGGMRPSMVVVFTGSKRKFCCE